MGLWIAMLGVTGSVLVYQHSLRQVLETGRRIKPGLPRMPLAGLLAGVHRQRPTTTVLGIRGLEYNDSALEVLVRPTRALRDGRQSVVLLVDPGTGEIGGQQTFSGTLIGFLAQLHINLLSAPTGLTLNAVAAGFAIFLVLSGVPLWWRGSSNWKKGLKVQRGISARRFTYQLHSTVGFYVGLFLLATSISGIYFATPQPFLSAAASAGGSSLAVMKDFFAALPSATKPGAPDASIDGVIATAQARFPGSQLYQVTMPLRPTDSWRLQFRPPGGASSGRTELAVVDRRSGQVLVARRSADLPAPIQAVMFLPPLHYGRFGGHATRVLWIVLGLTPALLLATGFLMWRRKSVVAS